MPQLLSDLVRAALATRADITVVGASASDEGVNDVVEQFDADVVITALPTNRSRALCRVLLVGHPQVSVIGIPDDRSGACQWQLRLHETPLGDVSPDELAEAIRSAHATSIKEAP
ncbi:MAG TPA: hypothetical protein VGD49_12860 [Longimicrobiales bacterium]